MLSIYRRHRTKCKYADNRTSKQCRCPLWATGTLEGKNFRRSLKTRNFERAEQLKSNIEKNGDQPEKQKGITITAALDAFISDCEARQLNTSTRSKYALLRNRLTTFAERHHLTRIAELQTENVRRFREGRSLSARTSAKELERLRSFFSFCISNDWLTKNPAKAIRPPQVKTLPRIPFDEKEVPAIIAQAKDDRELAFVLTLRHTGLRIGDASLLKVSQVSDGRVCLYTTKAGNVVSIKIPETLISLLKRLQPSGGYFFLRGESTRMQTTGDYWRRTFKRMCKDAGLLTADHPHRMRHTLAADLLTKGATTEQVAAILGNSPAIVAKHYSQWIKSRQDALDTLLEKTWQTKLTRVK